MGRPVGRRGGATVGRRSMRGRGPAWQAPAEGQWGGSSLSHGPLAVAAPERARRAAPARTRGRVHLARIPIDCPGPAPGRWADDGPPATARRKAWRVQGEPTRPTAMTAETFGAAETGPWPSPQRGRAVAPSLLVAVTVFIIRTYVCFVKCYFRALGGPSIRRLWSTPKPPPFLPLQGAIPRVPAPSTEPLRRPPRRRRTGLFRQ